MGTILRSGRTWFGTNTFSKRTFSCPVRPFWLSHHGSYSVRTAGPFCGEISMKLEVHGGSPYRLVVIYAWRYTSTPKESSAIYIYIVHHSVLVFHMILRTIRKYFPIQQNQVRYCNGEEECLL